MKAPGIHRGDHCRRLPGEANKKACLAAVDLIVLKMSY